MADNPLVTNLVRSMLVNDPAVPLGRADMDALIDWSKRGHASHGLTGLLLYSGGHYLQVLEGPAEAVAMAEQIDASPGPNRARRTHRVSCEVTDKRLFTAWTVRQLNLAVLPSEDRATLRWLAEWAADPAVAPEQSEVRELIDCLRRRAA